MHGMLRKLSPSTLHRPKRRHREHIVHMLPEPEPLVQLPELFSEMRAELPVECLSDFTAELEGNPPTTPPPSYSSSVQGNGYTLPANDGSWQAVLAPCMPLSTQESLSGVGEPLISASPQFEESGSNSYDDPLPPASTPILSFMDRRSHVGTLLISPMGSDSGVWSPPVQHDHDYTAATPAIMPASTSIDMPMSAPTHLADRHRSSYGQLRREILQGPDDHVISFLLDQLHTSACVYWNLLSVQTRRILAHTLSSPENALQIGAQALLKQLQGNVPSEQFDVLGIVFFGVVSGFTLYGDGFLQGVRDLAEIVSGWGGGGCSAECASLTRDQLISHRRVMRYCHAQCTGCEEVLAPAFRLLMSESISMFCAPLR